MKKFYRILTAPTLVLSIIVTCLLGTQCKKDPEDNSMLLAALALAGAGNTGARSNDAMVQIPAVLTGSTSTGAMTRTPLPAGTATEALKGVYVPVRNAIKIGAMLVSMGGQLKTAVDALGKTEISKYEFTDSKEAHPEQVLKVTNSSTFGSGGKKLEIWWVSTGSDALRDGKKKLEMEYTDSSGNIDGVMFFRHVPTASDTTCTAFHTQFVNVRLEYKKVAATNDRTALVHVENWPDSENGCNPGKASFYITEDGAGLVGVDGAYTITGLKMPFKDTNTTNWGTSDMRAYLFTAAGSDNYNGAGKAVVKVILPLTNETVTNNASVFNDANVWSLGELYTDGLLQYMNDTNTSCGILGTITILACVNAVVNPALSLTSTQAEVQTAMTQLETAGWSGATLDSLKVIIGIKNPVYFLKTGTTNALIGQENTTGLDSVPGVGTVADYDTIATKLRSTLRISTDGGGDFTPSGIAALNILTGTSVVPITGHPSGSAAWTGNTDAAP